MGSINIRKRGNVYQYSFEIAKIGGKRKQMTKSGFKTKFEAQQEGTKAFNEYFNTGNTFKENQVSYSDYLDYWIEHYCKSNLKYNTIQTYVTIINKYLKPNIGSYRLTSITSVRLNTFISELCMKHDYSRVYFANILKVLKGSFRDACDVYGLIKYNPALTIRLPKMNKSIEDVKHVYSQEEIEKILDRFKSDDTFTCAFLTSCYTGMRTGEVFALTWEDIDLENRIININHSVYDKKKDKKGRWFIGTTKTETGTRKIHISQTLYMALNNFKLKQDKLKKLYGNKYHYYHIEEEKNAYGKVVEYRIVENDNTGNTYNNINLVFTIHDGTYKGTDIIKYPYSIIHNELGIKKCRFYDLRGSYATKILKNGVEIRDVADILGHRNIETTENYYISSSKESRKEACDIFDNLTKSKIIDKIVQYEIEIP